MWSSGQDLAFSPPWPGFDSRHGKFAAMSILLHHQVGKKKPVSNAIVRHHFLQLQSSKLCPVRRLHNFNNNCNVVLLSTSNVRLTAPCGLVVRIWRPHRRRPGSIPGFRNLPLYGAISFFIKNKKNGLTQFISRQSLSNLMLRIQSRLALEIF